MKKIVSLLLCMLLLLAVMPASAQYVENSGFGIYFALNDKWTAGTNGAALRYRYEGKGDEYIEIRQTSVSDASLTMDNETLLLDLAETLLSDQSIEKEFAKANEVDVKVSTSYKDYGYINYNNIRYYKYEKTYTVSAKGYNSATYYDYLFLTIKNGKLYVISYSRISTQNHSSDFIDFLNSLYYNLNDIKIVVNNKVIQPDSAPYIQNNRTLVPIRAVAEALNYTVDWEPVTRVVTIKSADGSNSLRLCIDHFEATKNGTELIKLDVAPTIKDSRTYLPVRAVAETLGAKVSWDQNIQTVYIWQ